MRFWVWTLNLEIISHDAFNDVAEFLVANFPGRPREFWGVSMSKIAAHNNDGCGYILRASETGAIVATILVIRKDECGVSISSLAVNKDFAHITFPFLKSVLGTLSDKDIYNFSAIPSVTRLMSLLGFEVLSSSASLIIPSFGTSGWVLETPKYFENEMVLLFRNETLTKQARVKRCALRKSRGTFRNLGFLLDPPDTFELSELRSLAAVMLRSSLLLVAPTEHKSRYSHAINRWPTMVRARVPKEKLRLTTGWAQSEFEIMEF